MKKRFCKIIFKLIITVFLLEILYLTAVPFILEKFIDKDAVCAFVSEKTNAAIKADKLKITSRFPLSIAVTAYNIQAENKSLNAPVLSAKMLDFEMPLFPLLFKKAEPGHFYADNLQIFITRDENGNFNFENLFPALSQNRFKTELKNFEIITDGSLNISGALMPFDISLKCSSPFSYKDFSQNNIQGGIFLYNLNLHELSPVLKQFIPNLKNLSGDAEFIQISIRNKDKKTHEAVINAKFKDVLYDRIDWKNAVFAGGENKTDALIELFDNVIDIKHFKYNAENIDIAASGSIKLEDKPVLDITAAVKNSRAENIASILPPDLVKETMVFEKIKDYGVFGNIEGEAKIQGKIPKPDIKGRVKGTDVHILDEKTRKKHTGTADITFEGRTLKMDIKIDMPDNQKAEIKGRTYIYRDGINDVTVKTTNRLDFPLAHKLAVPVSRVCNFQLGPLPDMNITKGKGVLDIHVKGTMDFVNIDGFGAFDGAALTYKELYGKVTGAKGRLDFKDDIIDIKTEKAYLGANPVSVSGKVKINDNLDFNVSLLKAETSDLLEIVNKSGILKDVKEGLALFKSAEGDTDLAVNIKADIVPVPFNAPPLPPEEAFKNIKIKGSAFLNGLRCFLEGFNTPVLNVRGIVNFTEKETNFKDLTAFLGGSPVNIEGIVLTNIKTKIPDADITITSPAVKAGDTVRFLAESYFYPKNYPDINSFYNLDIEHDLYLRYKAKSKKFQTDKIYAVMNVTENSGSGIKGKSGRITLNNAAVNIEDIKAELFGTDAVISGIVKGIDKKEPVYNIEMTSESFNLENLAKINELNIVPAELTAVIEKCSDYKGFMTSWFEFKNNNFTLNADFKDVSFLYKEKNIPVKFDNFTAEIQNDILSAENITADISGTPVFINLKAENIYKKPNINAYTASKLTNELLTGLAGGNITDKITLSGDINIFAYIKGCIDDLNIKPQIVMHPGADAVISGVKIGNSSEKRMFNADINLSDNQINIGNLDYYVYITALNKTVYPVLFAYGSGNFRLNPETGQFEPDEMSINIEKSLSARLLNIFLDEPLLKQGTVTGAVKYKEGRLSGGMEAKNIDIPIADTIIKNIKLDTDEEDIKARFFGFINESALRAETSFDNDLTKKPHIDYLNIYADKIDAGKLSASLENARNAFNIKSDANTDFAVLEIEKGKIHSDVLTIQNLEAENVNGSFSIDKEGILKLDDINIKLKDGAVTGGILYDLKTGEILMQAGLKNIDSNYFSENLLDAENQIYGNANAEIFLKTKGSTNEEFIKNLSGFVYFDIQDGRMPKLGSLEYLLRAGNILKKGITGFSLNSVLELLNLVKTGYFSSISGSCTLDKGEAQNIEIFSRGENMSLYIHGKYDVWSAYADLEVLGKLSNEISTIFGPVGSASLNTFFKLIPGISLFDFRRKNITEDIEKIPSFTNGDYDARIFQALIKGDINSSGYVQSFKWIK